MPDTNKYHDQLLADYLKNNCTPEQVEALMNWLQQDGANRVLLQQLQAEFNEAMQTNAQAPAGVSNRLRERLIQSIQPPVRRIYTRWYVKVTAAAILILALGAGWVFLLHKGPAKDVASGKTDPPASAAATKRTGAYITLSGGKEIPLGNTVDGAVIEDLNLAEMSGNRVAYDTSAGNTTEVTWHTLTVPRGIKSVQLTLADGTLVWLNTASSLKYPTAFTGNERTIALTGEAYFDVKHNAGRPFTVRTKDLTVNVLGTGFNVSAYEDDEFSNVVLVKGSVALNANGAVGTPATKLTPGNMASFQIGAGRIAVTTVKTDEYVSWKDGYLIFRQAPLVQIVKRISRYYNVNINTSDLVHSDETFSGRLDLQNNIEDIMNLVCLGTSYLYLPKEQKLVIRK